MLLVSRAGPHKPWLEAEEGGDMHAAYSYALAKEAARIKPQEFGYEVLLLAFVLVVCFDCFCGAVVGLAHEMLASQLKTALLHCTTVVCNAMQCQKETRLATAWVLGRVLEFTQRP